MPITVICPKCSARLNAPDATAGKKVKCPRAACGTIVSVPVPAPASPDFDEEAPAPSPPPSVKKKTPVAPQPAAKKAAPSPVDYDDEEENERPRGKKVRDEAEEKPRGKQVRDEEDEEEEEPRPKSRKPEGRPAGKPQGRRPRDQDEEEEDRPRQLTHQDDEEEDDRPRRKRRQDDEEEDDDRPRKKKKVKQSSGMSPALIAGVAGGGLLVLVVMAAGAYFAFFKSPENDKTVSTSGSGGPNNQANSNSGRAEPGGSNEKSGVPAGWVEQKSPEDGFKAYFPSRPSVQTQPDGKNYQAVDLLSGKVCIVFIVKLPAGIPEDKKKDLASIAMKGMVDASGGKEISRKDVKTSGVASTELTLEIPADKAGFGGQTPGKGPPGKNTPGKKPKAPESGTVLAVYRLVTVHDMVFILGAAMEKGPAAEGFIKSFYDNFELLK